MPAAHTNHESRWRDTLAHWKRSGLTIADYCRRHHLTPSNFYRWKNKLASTDTPVPAFVPITLVADTRVEIVLPNGIVTKLPLDCEPTQLAAFLTAVKSC